MPEKKVAKGATALAASEEKILDPRFTSFVTDPRFRLPSKKHTRTKIDKRFSRMLRDDEFINTAKVDRYGRKLDHSSKRKALQRLYQVEKDDEDDEDDEEDVTDEMIARDLRKTDAKYDPAREGGFSSSEEESDDQEEDSIEAAETFPFPDPHAEQAAVPMGEITSRLAVVNLDWDNIRALDLMAVFSSFVRPGGTIESVAVFKSEFGKERMEREAIEGPPREIFLKNFQEMQSDVGSEDESEDNDELEEKIKNELIKEDSGKEYDSSALRQYQLERLRYYYAVVVCSDKDTARQIYESTDGTEYLSSANFIDLRFIPDDTEFDDEPRDECIGVPPEYKPTEFVTDALQHSNVKLTWDAEDPSRKDVIKRAFSGNRADIAENDLKAYIGSDSSDCEEEAVESESNHHKPTKKELARQKIRTALGLPEGPIDNARESKFEQAGDMEITFTPGLSAKEKGSVFENDPTKEETTAEAYIRKEKERKSRRKERARARREGLDTLNDVKDPKEQKPDLGFDDPFFGTDKAAIKKGARFARNEARHPENKAKAIKAREQASPNHLSIDDSVDRPTKAKEKKSRSRRNKPGGASGRGDSLQEGFEMDVSDPRFTAVFESHEYAIDPSNPKFKGTDGMKRLLEEGRKRKARGDLHVEQASASVGRQRNTGQDTSLKELVGIVKKKVKR